VTTSAVSHQLRELEIRLGCELTTRAGRGVALTADGRALLAELSPAFERIAGAVASLEATRAGRRTVTLSVLPWFAARWMIPRLAKLASAHPDIDLRISTSLRRVDLLREGFDAAIRYGGGVWPGVESEKLFDASLTVLAHRRLAERLGTADPCRLADWRPLRAASAPQDWGQWCRLAGVGEPAPAATYDTRELVLQAVLEGLGVGIVETAILQDQIRSGELVELFPNVRITGWAYWLVTPQGGRRSEAFSRFRAWLRGVSADG
jgi:LysR family glycine cleavage system transcriptional activator